MQPCFSFMLPSRAPSLYFCHSTWAASQAVRREDAWSLSVPWLMEGGIITLDKVVLIVYRSMI